MLPLSGYFDTEGALYDYNGLTRRKFNALSKTVQDEMEEYHKLYDIYHEYEGITNLATINKNAGKGPIKVDKKIIDLFEFSKDTYALTNGETNIAMGAVLSIWHKCREEAEENERNGTPELSRVPTLEELREAAKHTDINDLIIDREAGTVELRDPEMSLDVGAVGKGYAVEMVARMIEEKYGGGFVLDVGGNLRAIGTKPDSSGWLAGVRNPDQYGTETIVYKTEIKNAAMVTSGGYERSYTVGGVNYHHIINPETLFPENYYASVSVMTGSSALSDALSTALFNMEYDELSSFVSSQISSQKEIFVIIVFPDGRVETLGENFFETAEQ